MASERSKEYEKEVVARAAASLIENGMVVGLGSGSTAEWFVRVLGERVRDGLKFEGIATSLKTSRLAASLGIRVHDDFVPVHVDLTVDGADEFDPALRLIKGGGGDLLREKIVASASAHMVVLCDHSKQVQVLGHFPLAVEVIPMAWQLVLARLRELGVEAVRRGGDKPFVTDEGNWVLDCPFGRIADPEQLALQLDRIVGVVEHGLFLGLANEVWMAAGDRVEILRPPVA